MQDTRYRAFSRGSRGETVRKYVHRFLYENKIHRELKRSEVIHHIDGNKLNNTIENLELLTNSEHSRMHAIKNELGKRVRPKIYGNQYGKQLSKDIVEKLYKMLDNKITGVEIAKQLKIAKSTVSKYKIRKEQNDKC